MKEKNTPHPLDEAAMRFGSGAALARKLGVSRAALHQWKIAGREVPAEHAPIIEKLTGIKCEVLCPSVPWSMVRKK